MGTRPFSAITSLLVLLGAVLSSSLPLAAQPSSAPKAGSDALKKDMPGGQQGGKVKQRAVITMEKGGEIHIEFFSAAAPKTVLNFVTLAKKGFYDGLTFHRVEPGFVVQGGDPKGNGTGGPGYKIQAEFNKQKHVRGTLAMARSQDPDSAGSQFYICFRPAPFLDGNYTVFGQVSKGMEVVDGIKVGDRMKSVKIVEAAP